MNTRPTSRGQLEVGRDKSCVRRRWCGVCVRVSRTEYEVGESVSIRREHAAPERRGGQGHGRGLTGTAPIGRRDARCPNEHMKDHDRTWLTGPLTQSHNIEPSYVASSMTLGRGTRFAFRVSHSTHRPRSHTRHATQACLCADE